MQSLEKLLSIDRNFQTAVNLRLDREDNFKFKGYLPTTSSTALLRQLLENVAGEKGKGASVIIGPYGKGKSHLLLVLLALLEGQYPQEREELLERIGRVDSGCERIARKIGEKGPYFTVLVSDNGGSLNTSFLLALKEALDRKGILSLMPNSYYSEALEIIERWKQEFPQTFTKLEEILRSMPAFMQVENPILQLQGKLKEFDETALEIFRTIYPRLTAGTVFEPLINMEAVVLYQEVNRKLHEEFGYKGMYLVFDEFSKYIEGHTGAGFAADMKMLQDMCELANSCGQEKFFITFVTHKSLREYNSRFSKDLQNQFRGVEGRLQEYLFVDTVRNQFNLLGSVLRKTEAFDAEYEKIIKGESGKIVEQSYELPLFSAQFSKADFEDTVAKGCFPLTPLAAVLLLNLCEKVAQNERTLFTFLAGDENNSLYDAVHRKSQEGTSYFGAPLLYDYFAPLFRESADSPEIHQEWLKAEYALQQQQKTDKLYSQIIKTIAILQIAGNRQEFPIETKLVALALGRSQKEIEKAMEELTKQQLLIWRSKLGCYAFKNNIGINLEEELSEEMKKLPGRLDLTSQLGEVSELEYLLPKSYNQNYGITRYFQYVFVTPNVLQQMSDPKYLFQEAFADGKLIALVDESVIDPEAVKNQSKKWMESRVAVLVPARGFSQQENIRKVLALRRLLNNREFVEDNRVVEQELKLYLEDVLFEINACLEADFLPQNGGCKVIWQGEIHEFTKEKDFNAFLSRICDQYYAFSPKVNHELLNIQSVTGQYLRARNHVIDGILAGENMTQYEKGTSPEAIIYRAALVRTGVIGGRFPMDPGTDKILEEIRTFMQKSAEQKKCFAEIYSKLQGEGYGTRKGILPLFLALEYMSVAGTPVLYLQSKEVTISAEILNNINERPEEYFLYLEKVDGEKEQYLTELEHFLDIRGNSRNKQHRMQSIVEGLQQKYRALPKVVSNWRKYDTEEWSEQITLFSAGNSEMAWKETDIKILQLTAEKLMPLLRRVELNAREILFEKIPHLLNRDQGDMACAQAVEVIYRVWQSKLTHIKESLADQVLALWNGSHGENLGAYLSDWYRRQGDTVTKRIFSTKTMAFRKCMDSVAGRANEEVIASLARGVTGIYIEDWTSDTELEFLKSVRNAQSEIEQVSLQGKDSIGQKKVIFTDGDGKLVERSFQAEESGIGVFLKNAIREAMEEFGDSMDTGQKVAVLVETLEEILK